MKFSILIFYLLFFSIARASSFPADWETQDIFDQNLDAVLLEVRETVKDFPDCRDLVKFYPVNSEIHPVSNIPKVYAYFVDSVSDEGVNIRAVNRFGGRSYLFNYKWNVVHYLFETPAETERIGAVVIDWLTTDKFFSDEPDWEAVCIALGYRGSYTGKMSVESPFDILGCFGDFLICESLRPKIWKIVSGGTVFGDEAGREKCVRSILSNYESYPASLQEEVLKNISAYLETADDKDLFYLKKVAAFVAEKGGVVPDRSFKGKDGKDLIPITGSYSRLSREYIKKKQKEMGIDF